jgi:nitrate reductase NapD
MNLSGIYVLVVPDQFKSCVNEISQLPGVEVHYMEPEAGRLIVTLDTESDNAQVDGLKSIQALPNVILAELVYHRFDEEDDELESIDNSSMHQEEAASANQSQIQNYLNK